MFRTALTALALTLFAAAAVQAQDLKPRPLRFGWQASTPVAPFWVGFEQRTYEAQGLKLDLQSFNDNAPELEALTARQVDLAAVAPVPTLQMTSLGAPLKVIAAVEYAFTDKQGNRWSAVNLTARKDTGVQSLKDLAGKRIAVFGLSSNWYLALRDRFRGAGVDLNSVKFLSMPYTQMEGALVHNEVDAAVMTAIGAYHVSQRIPTTQLMTSDEITQIAIDMSQVITARADWLRDHEEEAVRFLMGMLATRKFIEDDVTQNGGVKVKEIMAKALKLDTETNEAFYKLRIASTGRERDLLNPLDLPKATFVAYGKILTESGQLRGKPVVTYEQIVDISYLRKAYERLGMKWDEDKVVSQ
ncbi:ABC-type nitrate/sulfonate/bicarbonate transport system substrate-binding protein [Bradyrhizobium sp. USDA 3240]